MSTVEVTVTTRDKDGASHSIDAEYKAQSSDVAGTANEILESVVKDHGRDSVTIIDPDR